MNRILILLFLFISTSFSQQFKAMTYNIRYENDWDLENSWELRKNKVLDLIKLYKPEFLGTQEALKSQLDYLDINLENYTYIGVGREDGSTKGEYSAILYDTTKFSLLHSSTFWLSETPNQISIGWDAALERICTFAIFINISNNDSIWVFNTHFDHQGKVARFESAKLIIRKIKNLTNKTKIPIILMGDFNSLPEEEPTIELNKYLNDSWNTSNNNNIGPIGTFNGFNTDHIVPRRIDYIFTKFINVIKTMHLDDRMNNNKYPSDHFPVISIFKYDK